MVRAGRAALGDPPQVSALIFRVSARRSKCDAVPFGSIKWEVFRSALFGRTPGTARALPPRRPVSMMVELRPLRRRRNWSGARLCSRATAPLLACGLAGFQARASSSLMGGPDRFGRSSGRSAVFLDNTEIPCRHYLKISSRRYANGCRGRRKSAVMQRSISLRRRQQRRRKARANATPRACAPMD